MLKRLGRYGEALQAVEAALAIDYGYAKAADLKKELLEKMGKD
jgi:hypothetical protein